MQKFVKHIILLIVVSSSLSAAQQLILVLTDDFNSTAAKLQRYIKNDQTYTKIGAAVSVNLGRNGLGWGIGITEIPHSKYDPIKIEGDGKAPAGIFALGTAFGYAPTLSTAMPYQEASLDLICVDDSRSVHYNQIVHISPRVMLNSFEWMKRDDRLYRIGITVNHNTAGLSRRGSCIFLHVEKAAGSPTSGCTSMQYNALKALLAWLDPYSKPLLIQIPAQYCSEVAKQFKGVCAQE